MKTKSTIDRAITALIWSLFLFVLVALLLLLYRQRTHPPRERLSGRPKGEPPAASVEHADDRAVLPGNSPPPKIGPSLAAETAPGDEAIGLVEEESEGAEVSWTEFDFRFRAVSEGTVVENPILSMEPISYYSQGARAPPAVFLDLSRRWREGASAPGQTSEGGGIQRFRHKVGISKDEGQLWAIGVFHPSFGSAYTEMPLSELLRLGETQRVIDFELQKGRSIAGRVVDEAGKPVAGATVEVSNAGVSPSGVDVLGLFALSGEDGTFEIVGLREDFQSTPGSITASLPPGCGESEVRLRGRKRIREENFDATRGSWFVGDVICKPVRR